MKKNINNATKVANMSKEEFRKLIQTLQEIAKG
jgi:hypothetical protein